MLPARATAGAVLIFRNVESGSTRIASRFIVECSVIEQTPRTSRRRKTSDVALHYAFHRTICITPAAFDKRRDRVAHSVECPTLLKSKNLPLREAAGCFPRSERK